MSMKAKQPKYSVGKAPYAKREQIKYYSTSEVGNMSRKVRIMAARAIMGSE